MKSVKTVEKLNFILDNLESTGYITNVDQLMRFLKQLGISLMRFEEAIGQRLADYANSEIRIANREEWDSIRIQVGRNVDLTNKFTAAMTGHTHKAKAGGLLVVHPNNADHPVVALGETAKNWYLNYRPENKVVLVENQALMTHYQQTRQFIKAELSHSIDPSYDLAFSSGMQALSEEYVGFYQYYKGIIALFDLDLGGLNQILTIAKICAKLNLTFDCCYPNSAEERIKSGTGSQISPEERKGLIGAVRRIEKCDSLIDSHKVRLIGLTKLILKYERKLEQEVYLLPYLKEAP